MWMFNGKAFQRARNKLPCGTVLKGTVPAVFICGIFWCVCVWWFKCVQLIHLNWLSCPVNTRNLPVSLSIALSSQAYTTMPRFYMGADGRLRCLACTGRALLTWTTSSATPAPCLLRMRLKYKCLILEL